MKSVPPLVARPNRHRLIAKPLTMPPKIQTSSTSLVNGMEGIRSVSTLVNAIIRQEYSVKRFPISRKLTTAGTTLRSRLIAVNGRETPANCCALRWMSSVSPLKPPGNRPPASTKLLMLTAITTDAATINSSRLSCSPQDCPRSNPPCFPCCSVPDIYAPTLN